MTAEVHLRPVDFPMANIICWRPWWMKSFAGEISSAP